MWHASVSYHGRITVPHLTLLARAHGVLIDVGDPIAGEWVEPGNGGVLHVRRRLAPVEQLRVSVRDIRHTAEARQRYEALPRQIRARIPSFVFEEEIGD